MLLRKKKLFYSVYLLFKNTIILFVFPSQILHKNCFYLLISPKRNWKQCLCKILEVQTKSIIMVFLILANIISFVDLVLSVKGLCSISFSFVL